ncbi:RNA polymerase sigma factor [Chitinophaga silvatica]|uniref:RNA polymerase sigma factor n=1 Tax=Chitinophaga silvatica TaxID=2282649 RepID=A0A3E1YHP8_9BACT|nr:RNA polymerase sigma factor [Chitinophaga silvatica]RFS26760.1 RNA polymerase sigma factor [Chitinophaga silvatica]
MLFNHSYEEKDLLSLVAEGDEKAFEIVIRQYGGHLHDFIVKLTRDSFVADELVQDTFLKIWQTREGLVFVSNFKAYLFTISRNLAINALKKTIKTKMYHSQWLAESPDATIDREAEDNDTWKWRLFDVAVENLPPQQKKVWVMARHERKKYHEIAAELHLTRETVKKYLQFAAAAIVKYIESHPEFCLLIALVFYNS